MWAGGIFGGGTGELLEGFVWAVESGRSGG